MTMSSIKREETNNEKLNVAQQKLVDLILDSLDDQIIPWNKPWEESLQAHPRNAKTGTEYKGSNQITLSIVSGVRGFTDPRWCTFNQAKENEWRIKKGAKGVKLCYPLLYNRTLKKVLLADDFKGLSQEEVNKLKSESTLRLKYFDVYNAQEIIGIPKLKEQEINKTIFSNQIASEISDNIFKSLDIPLTHQGDRAFYSQTHDAITMPEKRKFKSEELYYGTLFHELTHATGSKGRLNRVMGEQFGSESYSEEELVAEFSSVFLSQDLGLSNYNEDLNNNKAYIQAWADVIKNDPAIIKRAINNANNAYHFLYDAGNIKEYEEELKKVEVKDQFIDQDVSLEQLKRDVLITEYAENVLGLNLVAKGRNIISTTEHDSLMIYTDKNDFYRWSSAKGGNIIDFVMHMQDVDFKEALKLVKNYYYEYEPGVQNYAPSSGRKKNIVDPMELPEPAENNKKVISYLTKTRALPVGIVNDFIERGMLYQDKQDNCVFVGKLDDVPLYASRRGAKKSSNFKMDVASSIAEVGVFYDNKGSSLILTEGVIDAMSIMTLKSTSKNYDYLSTNGVAKAKQVLRFHMIKRDALERYERVIIAFDNDKAGEEATNELIDFINTEYPGIEVNHAYPESKDWNEELMNMVNMSKKYDGSDLNNNMTKVNAVGMSL